VALTERPALFSHWERRHVATSWQGVELLIKPPPVTASPLSRSNAPVSASNDTRLLLSSARHASSSLFDLVPGGVDAEPFVVSVPTQLNRSGCNEYVMAALCAARTSVNDSSTQPAESASWPVAWHNVPVQLLNRGVHALRPVGVPSSLVAAALTVPLLLPFMTCAFKRGPLRKRMRGRGH